MDILFPASEMVPFCKTGGLADVAGALPAEIVKALPGSRVICFLPRYKAVDAALHGLKKIPFALEIPVGDRTETARFLIHKAGKVETVFLDHPGYFGRPGIYGEGGSDYPDSAERYAFFCRAALEYCGKAKFAPAVIHCHDWQTGLIPAYLKTLYAKDASFKKTRSVFTIHNMAYQGNFPKESLPLTGLPWSVFTPDKLEFFGFMSYLKAGLVFADRITTVSPRYSREIRTDPRFGCGMEGLLARRAKSLSGILNGLDVDAWDPSKDPMIESNYSVKSKDLLTAKAECKLGLQARARLAPVKDAPLIGMVTRLDPQKGFKMLLQILPKMAAEHPKSQWAVLGSGLPEIEKELELQAGRFPGRFFFHKGFDEPLAHQIYAGADIFLMPSEYEPCGLGQMISMRYGTVPVVTPTGGLADTVGPDTGFVCAETSAPALHQALWKALKAFEDRTLWSRLMRRGMMKDFSWKTSARKYAELYKHG